MVGHPSKSELEGINVQDRFVGELAKVIGCGKGITLALLFWDPVLKKLSKDLEK